MNDVKRDLIAAILNMEQIMPESHRARYIRGWGPVTAKSSEKTLARYAMVLSACVLAVNEATK